MVGTATFTPSTANNYQGTLTYTVNNVGTVTKAIQRLTLTPVRLVANYVGGQSGSYSSCNSSASNSLYQDFYTLAGDWDGHERQPEIFLSERHSP